VDSSLAPLSAAAIAVFGLVLARVSGLLVTMPVFGSAQTPKQVKAGMAVVITLLFTPIVLGMQPQLPADYVTFGVMAGRELLIGLTLGFVSGLVFNGIQMGSKLIGVQIGFSLGGVFNPASGVDSGIVDSFYSVLATVIFLTANGHHAVLSALDETFRYAPVGLLTIPTISLGAAVAMVQTVFEVALRITMPVMAALLLADVALGLISRAAPQIQVIVVGAPAKVFAGIVMLGASTPATAALMDAVFRNLNRTVDQLLTH
jgi:flagellar biosynthesis protein FliR